MVVHIHIIESFDTWTFENEVNAYLKEWTGKIVNYSVGKNLVMVKHVWGKSVNVFKHEALFIVNEDIGKIQAPPMSINNPNETNRPSAIG